MADYLPLVDGDPSAVGGYDLLGRLAAGGQGVVYLGRRYDGRLVAVKLLHRQWLGSSGGSRYTLQREVDAARQVAPFCTAQILDAQLAEEPHYIVSEFVDGPSLSQQVAEYGPLTGTALDRLAIATATAVVAIHRAGVVHRDLKPANILLGPDGPRVIDFGIARPPDADTTQTTSLHGTPLYMAPEQFAGEPARQASDVFAWAASIAFAATGRPPFAAPTMVAIVQRITAGQADLDGIDEPLAGVLRRCLAVEPERRPTAPELLMVLLGHPSGAPGTGDLPDAGQVLAAASQAMTTQTAARPPVPQPAATVPPASPASPASVTSPSGQASPPGPRRRPVVAALAGGLVLVAVTVVGGMQAARSWAWFGGDTPTPSPSHDAGPSRSTVGRTGTRPTSDGAARTAAPSPSTTASEPGVNPTPSDVPGTDTPTLPSAAIGTWSGPVRQLGQGNWTARVVLAPEDSTLEAVELGCRSRLTLITRSGLALTFHQDLMPGSGATCAPSGTLRLTRAGRSMTAFWQDDAFALNTATGTLTRE